jgi:hypothetical protein
LKLTRFYLIYKKLLALCSCLIFIVTIFSHATPAFASKLEEQTEELHSDADESSKMLKKDRRFVPVPIPISNPSIGTGLGIAGIYLHPQKKGEPESVTSTSGVFGMYTDTDSWMVGVFHNGSYAHDRYRIKGILGYGEFNLDFYGVGDDSPLRDNPVNYNARGILFKPEILIRLPFENWFAGPQYSYLEIDTTFDRSSTDPTLEDLNAMTRTASLGIAVLYDSRNNNLWASDGTWFDLVASDYGNMWGGDFEYEKIVTAFTQYFPATEKITLSYRLDGQFISGDAPFYDLSYLRLRGFPMGRYADDVAVSAQVEGRWNFYKKWIGLIFGGGGRIGEDIGDIGSSPTHFAGGAGLRYLIAEKQKLSIGIDVTYGDEQVEFYIQIGDWMSN